MAMILAGCTTPRAPVRGSPAVGTASPLVVEQRWLNDWFRGTPVVIALEGGEALRVEVPLANSFETGRADPKPALAAVLDRVATSLLRQPATRVTIAAAADSSDAAGLATARIQRIRERLVASGVDRARVASVGAARTGAPVRLRITVMAQPIERLDDASTTAPGANPPTTGKRR